MGFYLNFRGDCIKIWEWPYNGKSLNPMRGEINVTVYPNISLNFS